VAQSGSAPGWGPGGRRFKSCLPDAEYERHQRAIAAIDEIVNRPDALRVARALSKAELARAIDKNPASLRRLFTAKGNPELGTVVAMADALGTDVVVVPRHKWRPLIDG